MHFEITKVLFNLYFKQEFIVNSLNTARKKVHVTSTTKEGIALIKDFEEMDLDRKKCTIIW